MVVPTYNRLSTLPACLTCLEQQACSVPYEVVVVDDGSTDGTVAWLVHAQTCAAASAPLPPQLPHVRLVALPRNAGAARARNAGADAAVGELLVFVDSDVLVSRRFLQAHWDAHLAAGAVSPHPPERPEPAYAPPCLAVGPVLHVHQVEAALEAVQQQRLRFNPLFDASRAYFCTSNASVSRWFFLQHGRFDEAFYRYGWEDLEAGERMRRAGAHSLRHVRLPLAAHGALAFHVKPRFSLEQVPRLLQQERDRGEMGMLFYRKMPTLSVRLMVQYTWVHRLLWTALTLGGLVNEHTMRPLLAGLIRLGQHDLALFLFTIVLNRVTCEAVFAAARHTRYRFSAPPI